MEKRGWRRIIRKDEDTFIVLSKQKDDSMLDVDYTLQIFINIDR